MLEYEVYDLLKKYGIKTPHYEIFDNYEPLVFDRFPAVLKIASPKIVHKSDVGGVRVGIHSNEELELAREEMITHLQSQGIFLDNEDKFLVEEQIEGEEFYIGGIYDAIFEEVLLFGKGGTLLEVEKDVCYIDIYADEEEILRSFKTTKISKIFPRFRHHDYKIEYVIEAVQKFQKLFKNEPIAEFDVNPLIYTEDGFVAVDARLRSGKKRRQVIRKGRPDLFENSSIAIFGATDKEEKVGYAIAKNALNSKATIYFVNPHLKELFGKEVYHSLDELPPIDTAVIAIPSKYVVDLVRNLAKRGVKNIIIISAGFKEVGNEEAEDELRRLADEYNLNIVGPNCLGIYNEDKDLNLTFAADTIQKGDLAIISQSGAVLSALIDKAATYSLGFSHIISLGNMADFSFSDAIETLQEKNSCKAISIYAEGLQHGKAYLEAIRKSKKPIYLYKAGHSDAAKKAAFSHTGNISGDYEMLINLSRAAGAIIKRDIDELIFASRYADKKEVLIITNAGGPGTILTDIVVAHGKRMYELDVALIQKLGAVLPSTWSHNNPIDIIGDATASRYEAALQIVKEIEALKLVIVTPQFMTDGLAIAKVLERYDVVPIFFGGKAFEEVFEYLRQRNILFFDDLENVANIL